MCHDSKYDFLEDLKFFNFQFFNECFKNASFWFGIKTFIGFLSRSKKNFQK